MPGYWTEHQGMLVLEPEPTTTDDIRAYGKKRPNVLSEDTYVSEVSNIAFVHSASAGDTITDGNNQFVIEGFEAGDMVRVSGSISNDGVYLLTAVVLGSLTLHTREVLTDEGISARKITFTTVTHFEEEYQNVLISLAAYRLARGRRDLFDEGKVNDLRNIYLEDRIEVWPGMDYKPQSVRVAHRRF